MNIYHKMATVICFLFSSCLASALTIETFTGRIFTNASLVYKSNAMFVGVRSSGSESLLKVSSIKPFRYTAKTGAEYTVKLVELDIDKVHVLYNNKRKVIKYSVVSEEFSRFFGFDLAVINEYQQFQAEEDSRVLNDEQDMLLYRIMNLLSPATASNRSGRSTAGYDFQQELLTLAKTQSIDAAPPATGRKSNSSFLSSIAFMEGSNGRGTGFFVNMWGRKILATNAHVFCKIKDIRIYNTDGLEFPVEAALISKKRDLAILSVGNCKTVPALSLRGNVSELMINSPVIVYGDSMGAGVFTKIPGDLVGIGFDRIETDAKFVPGNSGSPIIDKVSSDVIGLATYVQIMTDLHWSSSDTRFSASRGAKNIRRFGYRIDNIDIIEFDIYHARSSAAELEILSDLETRYNQLSNGKMSKSAWNSKLAECYSFGQPYTKIVWSNNYLKGAFEEKFNRIKHEVQTRGLSTIIRSISTRSNRL